MNFKFFNYFIIFFFINIFITLYYNNAILIITHFNINDDLLVWDSTEDFEIYKNVTNLTHQNHKINTVIHHIVKIPENYKHSKKTLEQIHNEGIKCLIQSNSPHGEPNVTFDFNYDLRYKHFLELKEMTAKYRKFPGHCYGSYCGEWIEDVWINTFLNESLSTFGPYIPLFIPWLNIFKKLNYDSPPYHIIVNEIFKLLKPNYLYITVVQGAYGIDGSFSIYNKIPNNIIVLSPAGRGHIPIPHLMRVLNVSEILPSQFMVSFIGNPGYITRTKAIEYFYKQYHDKFFFATRLKKWTEISKKSKVNLSPRGFANGCFRTYEMLQQGFIPVIIYDDIPWIPYKNSKIPINQIMIYGHINELEKIDEQIKNIDENRKNLMRKTILKFRHFYTYHGVMEQIALFMQGRGDLRCDKYNTRVNDGKKAKLHNVPDQKNTQNWW